MGFSYSLTEIYEIILKPALESTLFFYSANAFKIILNIIMVSLTWNFQELENLVCSSVSINSEDFYISSIFLNSLPKM